MKEKAEEWFEKKADEGEMWQQMMDNFERSIAPKLHYIGLNMFFLSAIAYIVFYFFQFDTQFWIFPINHTLPGFTAISGLVLKFRAEQILTPLTSNKDEVVQNEAKETTEILFEGTEMEGVNEEVEKMLEEEKEEKGEEGGSE